MAGMITLAQAEAKLTLWMTAEESLATSQSYEIDVDGSRRQLTRANLKEVAERITFWNGKVRDLTRSASGRSRTRYLVR